MVFRLCARGSGATKPAHESAHGAICAVKDASLDRPDYGEPIARWANPGKGDRPRLQIAWPAKENSFESVDGNAHMRETAMFGATHTPKRKTTKPPSPSHRPGTAGTYICEDGSMGALLARIESLVQDPRR